MKIKKEKIKYIGGDPQNGFLPDFNKVKKYFKMLNPPSDVWTPLHIDFSKADWFVELSKRSRGKTTNNLLFGIILYMMYGGETVYIRTDDAELRLAFVKRMFNIIYQYHYIEELTDNEYNSVYYHNKSFYLSYVNDEGIREKTDETPFMVVLSILMSEDAKSTLNLPLTVWVIFDEFMKHEYRHDIDEFYQLCQLISTIKRDRLRGAIKIIMPSNLVDIYSPYIDELGIRECLESMQNGKWTISQGSNGAEVYVEYIEDVQSVKDKKVLAAVKERNIQNGLFFGFTNPKLKSIVGGGWEFKNYPHLPKKEEDETRTLVFRDSYLYYSNKIICLEVWYSSINGYFINCREYFKTPKMDSIKFKIDVPYTIYDFYGFGERGNHLCAFIWKHYGLNRFFYANNTIGKLVESYVRDVRQLKK